MRLILNWTPANGLVPADIHLHAEDFPTNDGLEEMEKCVRAAYSSVKQMQERGRKLPTEKRQIIRVNVADLLPTEGKATR